MADEPTWKTALLSSGLPLEYEAARLLASKGFHVRWGLQYAPRDSAGVTDSSVDLHARSATPFSDASRVTGSLELVLECRHRRPKLNWLFLPEANPPAGFPACPGRVIRAVDRFCLYSVDDRACVAFEAELPICCKGLEIDLSSGRVDDSGLSGGLAQLQYALPRLMIQSVLRNFSDPGSENTPFLFCPVLLTTASLLVANKDLGVKEVEQASDLGELAGEVPYLVTTLEYGPDFEAHCQREFRALEALERTDALLMVESKRAGLCQSERELPVATIEALIAADGYWLQRLFTRFVVCTRSGLSTLIDRIQQAAERAIESRKQLR